MSAKGDPEKYIATLKKLSDQYAKKAQAMGNPRWSKMVTHACNELHDKKNPKFIEHLMRLKRVPVPIEEFILSPEFMGDQIEVWPKLWPDLKAINPDVLVGESPCFEALMGGATGTGKTTLSYSTNAYQLYLLTCFDSPQRMFDLQPVTPIVFMFQSVSTTVTRRVIYEPFRAMFTAMPYAKRYLSWDKYKEATLKLEGYFEVAPANAQVTSMVGQAIIGGILDEVNFMAVIESSKQVAGPRGQGGLYDQAEETYRNIVRRRKSRFITRGVNIGCICVISSTRYKDDFMDRRMAEVTEDKEKGVHLFRRKQYEVQPSSRYSGATFKVLIGTDRYPTRIIDPERDVAGETYPSDARIEDVPIEYYTDFRRDPDRSLRDVIGVATDSINPFISQRHKIIEAAEEGQRLGIRNWVDIEEVDLATQGFPQIIEGNLPPMGERRKPRWIHVDLAIKKDRCGVAVIRPAGMVNINNPEQPELVETVPKFIVECAFAIQPGPMAELDIGELRAWIMQLSTRWGFNIFEVTYDGFQSRESIQALRRSGVSSRQISMDRTVEPYEYLRRAYYTDRIICPQIPLLERELAELEFHAEKVKIDHPPKGSKDLADAVCGAIYACGSGRAYRGEQGFNNPEGRPIAASRPPGRSFRQRPLGRYGRTQ